MTSKQDATGKSEVKGTVIRLETLHIAACPRELARRRLRLLPTSHFDLPAAA